MPSWTIAGGGFLSAGLALTPPIDAAPPALDAPGALLLSLGITIGIAVPVTWLVSHHRHTRPSPSRARGDDGGLH